MQEPRAKIDDIDECASVYWSNHIEWLAYEMPRTLPGNAKGAEIAILHEAIKIALHAMGASEENEFEVSICGKG